MLRSISTELARHSRHLSNVGAFLAARLFALGLYAVSMPIFINRTSEAAYGVIAIGFSFIGLGMLLEVGVGYVIAQGIGRRLARTGKLHIKLFNTLFWVYLLCSIVMAVLLTLIFVNVGLSDDELNLFVWIGLLLPSLAISGVVAAVFQANNSLVYLNISRFIFDAGKAFSLIISAIFFAKSIAVGPILFFIVLLRALLDIWQLRVRLGYRVYPPKLVEMRRAQPLLMLGLPSLWTVLLTLLVNIGDKLIIAKLFSKADVAYYSLAFDINTKAYLILGAINSAMYAIMIRNHAVRRSSSTQMIIALISVAAIGIIYYLPLAFFSKQILGFWVSSDIGTAAAHLVPIFSLASLAYLCGNVFEILLLSKGFALKVFQIYFLSVSMYFITLFLLINQLGLTAFAWAYVVMNMTMFAGTSLTYWIYTEKYKV